MRCKEFEEAERLLQRLLTFMGSGHVHDAEVRILTREVMKLNRGGGKDDTRRLRRVVRIMSKVLFEEVLTKKGGR